MKLYSKKHLIYGLITLGFSLYLVWGGWMAGDHPLLIALIGFCSFPYAAAEFRCALNRKYAAATLVAEQDELEKIRQYKADRIAFWASVYVLLWLSCCWEEGTKDQPAFAYGFLAAAGLLLLLRWGIVFLRSHRPAGRD